MALTEYDIYSAWTPAYGAGTEDSGKGVGLLVPNPGFADWQAYAAIPNGIQQTPVGWWTHGTDFFLCYNGTDGTGRGIYRYTIGNDGSLTYQDYVGFAALGFAGSQFANATWGKCADYDSVTGTVNIVSEPTSGTGNTPIVQQWDCDNWPFTNSNQEWSSGLAQSYGSFVSGQLARAAISMRCSGKFYMVSQNAGQVITLDDTDGSVLGVWEFYGVYSTTFPFQLLGIDSSGNPYGGSYHASGGDKDIYKWDASNLSAWATDTKIMEDSGSSGYPHSPAYLRSVCQLYAGRYRAYPLSKTELACLGMADMLVWWVRVRQTGYGEWILHYYDPATGEFAEVPVAETSVRRSVGNSSFEISPTFILVNTVPWCVSFSEFSMDIEDANPGGFYPSQIGLSFCPVGPGTVTYTKTTTATATPKRMLISVEKTAVNYLNAESYQKHQFAMENVTAGGGISDYRCGEQELSHLDEVINGKAAWPAITNGDEVKIYHKISSGWPNAFDQTVSVNPGEVGDPTSPASGTADFAPPREIRPIFLVDESLPGAGQTQGPAPIAVGAYDTKPVAQWAEEIP